MSASGGEPEPAGKSLHLLGLRRQHSKAVLAALGNVEAATHAALAGETGLSKATVSRILAELGRRGVVSVVGTTEGRAGPRGRRPLLVRLNPEARLAVGIEFEDSRCIAVLTDLRAQVQAQAAVPAAYESGDALVRTAVAAFRSVTKGVARRRVCAVGVGSPGVVDTAAGILRVAPQLGALRDVPLAARLRASLGIPVTIASRSKAAAMGEHLYGVGRGCDDLLYVWIGSGVAAGIVMGGTLQLGATGGAGAFGHIVVDEDGPSCDCGARGCLQAVASGPAIARRACSLLRAGVGTSALDRLTGGLLDLVDAHMVIRAAREGDALAARVLEETGSAVGRALAAAVNLLNPAITIIGGPVGESAAPLLIPAIERELRSRALSATRASLRLVPGTMGGNAGAIGAAALALEHAVPEAAHTYRQSDTVLDSSALSTRSGDA